MLSKTEYIVSKKLRDLVGSDRKGIGPDIDELIKMFKEMESYDLRVALDGLNSFGFIKFEKRIGTPRPGIPDEFRDIVGVTVLEPLQSYFDEEH